MNPIDDEKLMMIYFDEAEKADIEEGLKSPELCQQLDQLEADMNIIDNAQNAGHTLPDDYGQQLWNQIADRLPDAPAVPTTGANFWQRLSAWLMQPQYSLASVATEPSSAVDHPRRSSSKSSILFSKTRACSFSAFVVAWATS